MNIALVSMNQVWEDKAANLKQCQLFAEQASNNGVDLIVFPEMTLTGFSMNTSIIGEKEYQSNTVEKLQNIATKNKIAIVFGVVFLDEGKATNNLIFIDDEGKVGSKYAKIHPFSFAGEDKYYGVGDELVVQNFQGANIGLTICYDLRFPELYSALSRTCDMVINIANWPAKRIDHWKTLLKSRAIENQYFCIGVNRTGVDGNGLSYEESSFIFNADGVSLPSNSLGSNISMYRVDTNWTISYRKGFSTLQDRRLSLYAKLYK